MALHGAAGMDFVPFAIFLMCAVLQLGSSALYHTMLCEAMAVAVRSLCNARV